MFDGLASFDWASAHDWLSDDKIYGFNKRHLKIERLECEVRRWDDVTTEPGLVKIDVQGHEASVLEGGIQTIRTHRPVLLLENSKDAEPEQLLFREGYRSASYQRQFMKLDSTGDKDTFYIPEEKLESILRLFP